MNIVMAPESIRASTCTFLPWTHKVTGRQNEFLEWDELIRASSTVQLSKVESPRMYSLRSMQVSRGSGRENLLDRMAFPFAGNSEFHPFQEVPQF